MRPLLCKCFLGCRRALAGVHGLVASVDRVKLDDMALELGQRHLLVLLQGPARRELDRFCSDNGIVLGPRHAPHGPPLRPAAGHQLHQVVQLALAELVQAGERRRTWQSCGRPFFGLKRGVRDGRDLLSLAHEAPRRPSAAFALVLLLAHLVQAV